MKTFLIAVVLVAIVAGGYFYFLKPGVYVTPGGITLLQSPKGWQVKADTLTWDTQNQPKGEHIEFTPAERSAATSITPPYIIVNLGPETPSITVEGYVSDLKREIQSVGGTISNEEAISIAGATGRSLELTAKEDGMDVHSRVVVVMKEGTVYQLTAVAEEKDWLTQSSVFEKVIQSLQLTR